MVVTRIAPSPSGYLHAGNAVNFLLTQWIADREPDSRIHLRIDDISCPDPPVAYLDDIFWAVEWLGIRITDGPSDVADFRANYAQTREVASFREVLPLLVADPATYACDCTRRDVAARPTGAHDPCRQRDLHLIPGRNALRLRVDRADDTRPLARVGLTPEQVADSMGDFVVWRKDDLPAYQLVSVLIDDGWEVDTVVRGEDLRPSTGAQLLLAQRLAATSFPTATFLHHPLITDATGTKLSKTAGADSLREIAATPGGRSRLEQRAREVAASTNWGQQLGT